MQQCFAVSGSKDIPPSYLKSLSPGTFRGSKLHCKLAWQWYYRHGYLTGQEHACLDFARFSGSFRSGMVEAAIGVAKDCCRDDMQGHAGTVPMALRRDPMVGAAEAIQRVESICNGGPGQKDRPASEPAGSDTSLVCTVGSITVWPGSSNVIPGHVNFSIDIRWVAKRPDFCCCRFLVRRMETTCKGCWSDHQLASVFCHVTQAKHLSRQYPPGISIAMSKSCFAQDISRPI